MKKMVLRKFPSPSGEFPPQKFPPIKLLPGKSPLGKLPPRKFSPQIFPPISLIAFLHFLLINFHKSKDFSTKTELQSSLLSNINDSGDNNEKKENSGRNI